MPPLGPVVSLQELSSTYEDHIKKEIIATSFNRVMMYYLRKDGGLEGSRGGTAFDWPVNFRDYEWTPDDDTVAPNFEQMDSDRTATLSWKSGNLAKQLPRRIMERNMHQPTQIINLLGQLGEVVQMAFRNTFPKMLFNSSASDASKFDGLETLFQAATTTTVATQGGNGRCRFPTGTYAGLSLVPGNVAGTWDNGTGAYSAVSAWPHGNGDAAYAFYSPIIANTTSTTWGTSPSFAAYADDQLKWLLTMLRKIPNPEGPPNLIMLAPEMLLDLETYYQSQSRVVLGDRPMEPSVNFSVKNFNGCDLTQDFDIDSGVGYAYNTRAWKYRSIYPDFIQTSPFVKTEDGSRTLVRGDYHGNCRANTPRGFGKLVALGANDS